MWPDDRLRRLLGVEHPIIQAPMAGATTPALAAAVSNAGGLGTFGAAGTAPDALRAVIREIRSLTDRPFGVNLFVKSTEGYDPDPAREAEVHGLLAPMYAELDAGEMPEPAGLFGPFDEQLAVIVEESVPVFSFHLGIPDDDALARLRSAGTVIMGSATNVEEARALTAVDIDAIVAQGAEAGGHRGTFAVPWEQALIGTMALVPQVVDAVEVPVAAAGAVMDGRGIAASFALGASGVQMGTAFLGCPESAVHPAYRQRLLAARDDDTVVTTVISGKPARGIRNRYIEALTPHRDSLLPFSAQYRAYSGLRAAAAARGDAEYLPMWAGQALTLTRSLPAADLMAEVVEDARSRLASLGATGA